MMSSCMALTRILKVLLALSSQQLVSTGEVWVCTASVSLMVPLLRPCQSSPLSSLLLLLLSKLLPVYTATVKSSQIARVSKNSITTKDAAGI